MKKENKIGFSLVVIAIIIFSFVLYEINHYNYVNSQPMEEIGSITTDDGEIKVTTYYKEGISEDVFIVFYMLSFFALSLLLLGFFVSDLPKNIKNIVLR